MPTLSYTAARAHLSKTMQCVCEDHVPVIITRSNAEPIVMISLSDFEAMQETNYLMRSPNNVTRLVEAIDEIEQMIVQDKSS